MENQAGVMLPLTPAQAEGNWGALLPLWKHPQNHPAEGHRCVVSSRVMFPWLLHSLLGVEVIWACHNSLSTPLLSTPSSCCALQCMDAEISLTGPPVQPNASLPRTLCALTRCHSSKVPLCLSVPCLSSCFLSPSKLQKYLIKGGFTFKPVQQVKLHAGEQLTPTMCYLLSVCSDHCDCTCTISQLPCPLDFLARASRETKKE